MLGESRESVTKEYEAIQPQTSGDDAEEQQQARIARHMHGQMHVHRHTCARFACASMHMPRMHANTCVDGRTDGRAGGGD